MKSLREAIEQGELEQFVAERRGETGDKEAFDATLRSMAEKSKEAPAASSRGGCGD